MKTETKEFTCRLLKIAIVAMLVNVVILFVLAFVSAAIGTPTPRIYSQVECKKAIEYLELKGTRYDN